MSAADAHPRLLGDIGGTHARFAWIEAPGAPLGSLHQYACSDHDGLESVIRAHLGEVRRPLPPACAIGIATTPDGDRVTMTNRDWSFSIAELQRRLGLRHFIVVNDFAALALAVPLLGADELRRIGGGLAAAGGALAVLGAGTGLGVAGLLPRPPGGWLPIVGEGGHATLSAADAVDERLIALLRECWPHVSGERVLSGQGLVNLYQAHCRLSGQPADKLGPADIVAAALSGSDDRCVETVERFCGFLGSFAGNLALTLGAQGGVYIGGGIVPRLGERFAASSFRSRFESKGRFESYLARIPTWVITASAAAALRGANEALDEHLRASVA